MNIFRVHPIIYMNISDFHSFFGRICKYQVKLDWKRDVYNTNPWQPEVHSNFSTESMYALPNYQLNFVIYKIWLNHAFSYQTCKENGNQIDRLIVIATCPCTQETAQLPMKMRQWSESDRSAYTHACIHVQSILLLQQYVTILHYAI